jgi:hypothetical protein
MLDDIVLWRLFVESVWHLVPPPFMVVTLGWFTVAEFGTELVLVISEVH